MEDIQQSELRFYLPVIAGYVVACLVAWRLFLKFDLWNQQKQHSPEKPIKELIYSLLAVVLIFIIGRFYEAGFLLSSKQYPSVIWIINNLIIFSPMFFCLWWRKQHIETTLISAHVIHKRIFVGFAAAIIGVSTFLLLRGEGFRWIEILDRAIAPKGMANFVPVFLEGMVIAFLFVRLKWVSNLKVALAIPSALFAIGHLPGMIADGDPWWHMTFMSAVTGVISVFVLFTCFKARDIIWLGIVHYFMDVAIRAF